MIGFIYKTTNTINGKSYIGLCSSAKRFENYLGSGVLLKQAIKKYGADNFKREILEECDSEKDLREAEKRWIDHFNATESKKFYNLHEGGRGGYIPKKKGTMSTPMKKYWSNLTEEERKGRNKSSGRYDKFGGKNPRARKAVVNEKVYDCLKDALKDHDIPYSSLKKLANGETSQKWSHIKVEYI